MTLAVDFYDLYIKDGNLLVNVTEYHPEVLKLTVSDLEKMLERLK